MQTPGSVAWVVDTLAPDTTIVIKPPALSNSAAAAFTFSTDETGATFECKLDLADFDACGASPAYTNLVRRAARPHRARARRGGKPRRQPGVACLDDRHGPPGDDDRKRAARPEQ